MESGSKRRRRSIRNLRRSSSNFLVPNRSVLDVETVENDDDGCKDGERSDLAGYGSAWVDDEPVMVKPHNQPKNESILVNKSEDTSLCCLNDVVNILSVSREPVEEGEIQELDSDCYSQVSIEKPRQGDSFGEVNVNCSSSESTVNSPLNISANSNSNLELGAHDSSLDIAQFLYSPETRAIIQSERECSKPSRSEESYIGETAEFYNGHHSLDKGFMSYHDPSPQTVVTPLHSLDSKQHNQHEALAVTNASKENVASVYTDSSKSSGISTKAPSLSLNDGNNTALCDPCVNETVESAMYTMSTPGANSGLTSSSLKVTFQKVPDVLTNAVSYVPCFDETKRKKEKIPSHKAARKEKTPKVSLSQKSSSRMPGPKSRSSTGNSSCVPRSHPKPSDSGRQQCPEVQKLFPCKSKSKGKFDIVPDQPLPSIPDVDETVSPVPQLEIAQSDYSPSTSDTSSVLGTSMAYVIQQLSSKLQALQTGLGNSSPRSLAHRQLESSSVVSGKEESKRLMFGEKAENNIERSDTSGNVEDKELTQGEMVVSNDCTFDCEINKVIPSGCVNKKSKDTTMLSVNTDDCEEVLDKLDPHKTSDDVSQVSVTDYAPENVKVKAGKKEKFKKKTRLSLDKTSREKSQGNLKTVDQCVENPSDVESNAGKNCVKIKETTAYLESNTLKEDLLPVAQGDAEKDKTVEDNHLAIGGNIVSLCDIEEPDISFQYVGFDIPSDYHYNNTNTEVNENRNLACEEAVPSFQVCDNNKRKKKQEGQLKKKTKSTRRSSRFFLPEEINLKSPADEQENFLLPDLLSTEGENILKEKALNFENSNFGSSSTKVPSHTDAFQSPIKDLSLREYASVLLEDNNSQLKDRKKMEEMIEDFVSLCVEEDKGLNKSDPDIIDSQRVKRRQKEKRRSSIYKASGDYNDEKMGQDNDCGQNVKKVCGFQGEINSVSGGMREEILTESSFHTAQLNQYLDVNSVEMTISAVCNTQDEKMDNHIASISNLADGGDAVILNQTQPTEDTDNSNTLVPYTRRSVRTSRNRKSSDFNPTDSSSEDTTKKTLRRRAKKRDSGDTQSLYKSLIALQLDSPEGATHQLTDDPLGQTPLGDGEEVIEINQEVRDYYCNKNYIHPKPRSWETIKESPTNQLNVFTKTRLKRILMFEHGVTTAKLQRRRRKSMEILKCGCGVLTPVSDEEFEKKMMDVGLLLDSL